MAEIHITGQKMLKSINAEFQEALQGISVSTEELLLRILRNHSMKSMESAVRLHTTIRTVSATTHPEPMTT